MSEEIEILSLGPQGLGIGLGPHVALVPTALLEREMMEVTGDGAAQWASAQRHELMAAISQLVNGQTPPAPFDALVLETEV
jgi:hypothetical protein